MRNKKTEYFNSSLYQYLNNTHGMLSSVVTLLVIQGDPTGFSRNVLER